MCEVSNIFLQILNLFSRVAVGSGQKKSRYVDECETNALKQLEQLSVENALLSNKDN